MCKVQGCILLLQSMPDKVSLSKAIHECHAVQRLSLNTVRSDWKEHKTICEKGGGEFQELAQDERRDAQAQEYVTPQGYLVSKKKKP